MFGLRAAKDSDLEGQRCPGGTGCPGIQDQVDTRNTFGNVRLGAFIIGGAALAGMIVYLAIPSSDHPRDKRSASLTPGCDGADVGASFTLHF